MPTSARPRPSDDFVQSLAKGLAVIASFDAEHAAMTLSDVARRAGTTRAAARRLLHTLVELGYAQTDGKRFSLRPKVLDLGFAYLHGTGLWGIAQSYMVELVEQVHESCSAAVLDGDDIVYVARVPTRERLMSISLGLGSRLPAHLTSMGRVLLAELDDDTLRQRLATMARQPARTLHSLTDPDTLMREILRVRADGHAILDQELELGLRSVAVPLRGADGRAVAALNVSTPATRNTLADIRRRILPPLARTGTAISRALGAPLDPHAERTG